MKSVNDNIKSTQSQLRDVERLLKLDPGNITLLVQKHQLLAKAIEDTKKKLETLKEAERQAQEQFRRGEISKEQYQELQREIIATEQKLKDLKAQANLVGEAFKKGFKVAAEATVELTKAAAKGFEAVESVGKKAGDAVSAALKGFATTATAVAGFGTAAVKSGASFDQAMSQVAATLGLTTSDIENNVNGAGDMFDMLRNKALQAGSETNFTAKEAAEGLNILVMSGYDAYSAVDMLDDVLHLAAAGSMDMASAAGYISGAVKGFNDEIKGSAYYADMMAKGATLANTSVTQLGEGLSNSAATAKTYGQSAETTTLALLRLAEQGETGSAAATALAAAMKNLYAPTDSAKKVMQELGVNAFDPATGSARERGFRVTASPALCPL